MSRSRLCAALLATWSCADGVDDVGTTRQNTPPEAALKAPVIAPVGRAVALDASASHDPDGDPLTYVFELNDGSERVHSVEPILQHAFGAVGLFTVVVRVTDLSGVEARAAQDVAVRAEYPDPPDFCLAADDCVVGNLCEGSVCFTTGGALD